MEEKSQKQNVQDSEKKKDNSVAKLVMVLAALLIVAVLWGLTSDSPMFIYVICIVSVIAVFLIFAIIAVLCNNRLQGALNLQCNPYKYHRYFLFVRSFVTILAPGYYIKNKINYQILHALGLRHQGKLDKALKVLLSIDKNKFSSLAQQVTYFNNLCDIYFLLNDYDLAQKALDVGFCALESITDAKDYKTLFGYLRDNQLCIKMLALGDTSGVEEFYLTAITEADNELSRVGARLCLGMYYQLIKQYDVALLHFKYVIQHGNRLVAVKLAKEYIEKIQANIGMEI